MIVESKWNESEQLLSRIFSEIEEINSKNLKTFA